MNTNILFGTIALLMALISGIAAGALVKTPGAIESISKESVEVIERTIDEVLPETDNQKNDNSDMNDDTEMDQEGSDEDTNVSTGNSSSEAAVGSTPTLTERTFTATEVATHNSDASCYVIISGIVYDVTPFIEQHPGGAFRIRPLCGKDGTTAFTEKHGGDEKPANVLEGLEIGILK